MREIKFRVWFPPYDETEDGKVIHYEGSMNYNPQFEKVTVYTKELFDEGALAKAVKGNINEAFVDSGNPIMQFTGLKDKNGKDIYEGDILSNDRYADELRQVIWNDVGALFQTVYFRAIQIRTSGGRFPNSMPLDTDWHFEIIGNIYQNPELLKQ